MADIAFDSEGCRLAGTFAEVPNPIAAAVLIVGSGPVDRDSNHRGLRFDVTAAIAEALAGVGVSSLRYDKRGVGASTGDYLPTGLAQQLTDARAAVRWLADHAPGVPLLAIGHSEGSLHAIELAAEHSVSGAGLISCGARGGEEVLIWQGEKIFGTLPKWYNAALRVLRVNPLAIQRKRIERIKNSTADVIRIQGVRLNARWLREFIAYDPRPALARIDVPVLALTGGNDLQVPPDDVRVIEGLVKGPFEGHIVGDLSHILRPDPKPAGPRGYRRAVKEPVSAAALGIIAAWAAGRRAEQPGEIARTPAT
ncbi:MULTISPECIES: alpha/beta hydrolase [unclassified Nocardia]|uniref:alpha/beta hydrolase n=1 Tax=unclassified Nocardia TaxID=2637762 RepID=UPI001CE440BD|nr:MULTISPECIES: alpha/beta hydrolase [unclassified Nocardia]